MNEGRREEGTVHTPPVYTRMQHIYVHVNNHASIHMDCNIYMQVNAVDRLGNTPLMQACQFDSGDELGKLLIEKGKCQPSLTSILSQRG